MTQQNNCIHISQMLLKIKINVHLLFNGINLYVEKYKINILHTRNKISIASSCFSLPVVGTETFYNKVI